MALSRALMSTVCPRRAPSVFTLETGRRLKNSAVSAAKAKEEEEIDHALRYYPLMIQKHGKRDVIGHGKDGDPNYIDMREIPIPSVRFREETPYITELRQKEKGDWNKLTHAEMKELYRHTFCMTYAEMLAPSGEWKIPISATLMNLGVSLWLFLFATYFILKPYPVSMTDPELLRQNYQLLLDNEYGIVHGMASDWDYEKGQWKK